MKQAWTLARREFRSYFDHPTAYILVIAFLGLALFLTFRSLYAVNVATLRGFFSLLPWLFAVFVPAIAMRSFADERRSGTLEWLVAQPVNELELVGGKFLGDWLFALATLAGTLPTALGVLLVSDADAGVLVAQYIGAALLAAQMVAIGLFASSATRNQITAFILAVAISFVLILAGLPVVTIGFPAALAAAAARLSLLGHFESIARGVLDLRDVLYFVSTAGLFLGLAYFLLVRERLSRLRGAYRRLRLGVAGIAAGVLVLNLLGARIHGRLDLTGDRLYTLSPGTERVLEGLDDVVTIRLFVSSELPPEIGIALRDVRDLLADYRRIGDGRVQVVEANPDRDEAAADEARSLGVQEIQFNVMRNDEFQIRRGWFGLAVLYADGSQVVPVIDRTDDLEYRLTSMISALTTESKPRLAFLTGFGARPAVEFGIFNEALADRYTIETVNLARDSVPVLSADSFDVVVLAAPSQPLGQDALAAIDAYLDAGGAAFLLLDGTTIDPRLPISQPVTTGVGPLLEARGLRLAEGMVYDLRSNEAVSAGQRGIFPVIARYPLWPIVLPAGEHTLTRNLEGLSLGWASPLEVLDSAAVVPLWTTTEFAGRRPGGSPISPDVEIAPDPAELTPQIVAAAVEAPAEGGDGTDRAAGRLVVIGDADFLDDRFIQGNPQNLVFAANAIDWLAQDDALIAIRSKDRTPPPLVFESELQQATLKWGNLIGVPLLFVVTGIARVVGRRRLSGRIWQEVEA